MHNIDSKDYLLSVVSNSDGDMVSIHLDLKGVENLIAELESLKDVLLKNENEHTHLFSEDWGGYHLTTTKLEHQEVEVNQVHHVKIYAWNDEWKHKYKLV